MITSAESGDGAAREPRDTFRPRARRADDSVDVSEASLLRAKAPGEPHDGHAAQQAAGYALRSLKSQYGDNRPQAQRARGVII